jgi:hypothetical protein
MLFTLQGGEEWWRSGVGDPLFGHEYLILGKINVGLVMCPLIHQDDRGMLHWTKEAAGVDHD